MKKTKYIPLIIMLAAGSICSLICILNEYELERMLLTLMIVLVSFYIFGLIIMLLMDKTVKDRDARLAVEGAEGEEVQLDENGEPIITDNSTGEEKAEGLENIEENDSQG